MSFLFHGCSNLVDLKISGFGTSKVEYMDSMFEGCSKLVAVVGLSSWNVSNVINTDCMFKNCSLLLTLTLPDSLTIIGGSFAEGCAALTKVVMGDNVKSLGWMSFCYDGKITEFHLSSNITSIANYSFWGVNGTGGCKFIWRGNTYTSKDALKTALTNAGVTDITIN